MYIGDIATCFEIINVRSKKTNFLLEFDKALGAWTFALGWLQPS